MYCFYECWVFDKQYQSNGNFVQMLYRLGEQMSDVKPIKYQKVQIAGSE